jgi:hypothetical protein
VARGVGQSVARYSHDLLSFDVVSRLMALVDT